MTESPSGSTTTETCYTIGGVKVHFPAKAYPSQISMMDKVNNSKVKHKVFA